jgi:antitoxin VapB
MAAFWESIDRLHGGDRQERAKAHSDRLDAAAATLRRRPAAQGRAKLFTHGGSQAVRLPKEFRFEGQEVEIFRDGGSVVLRPVRRSTEELWKEIDARRGDEVFPYPPQAVLEDRDYGFDL